MADERTGLAVLLGAALAGCGTERPDPFDTGFGGAPIGTDTGVVSAGSAATDPAGDDADDGGDDGGDADSQAEGAPSFDVGGTDLRGAGPEGTDPACEKVDLLFVIDNSQSMDDEQAHLLASFPGFIAQMKQQLEGVDYHIGVTTSDGVACNPEPCRKHGALVTQTCGVGSSEAVCGPYAAGETYMTDADDLEATFDCAGRVGTAGDFDEKPMLALLEAVGSELNAPGACNDGFVRPDALLVVVLVTDEEDDDEFACNAFPGSGGGPDQWFDTVVAVKGTETNAAVLALIGLPPPDDCPPKVCGVLDGASDAEIAPRLLDFTNRFTHGFVGRICADDYEAFFADAIGVIDSACDDFVPRG